MKRRFGRGLVVAIVMSLLGTMPQAVRSATPTTGVLNAGGTVTWSGGPLTGNARRGPTAGYPTDQCTTVTCDDFMLDIQVATPSDPNVVQVVDITVTTANQDAV
ncbi:MAG TPA: hypothetical protein VHF47_12885, partial [Acidimicrobiales bacterium]|nr:hypothetical protein [Acidimicrobiales bacterium]